MNFVPHNSAPWFQVLWQAGTWKAWLESNNESLIRQALWFLGKPNVINSHGLEVAQLLWPYFKLGDLWRNRLTSILCIYEFWRNRATYDLLIYALKEGWLDTADIWHYHFDKLPKYNPPLAAELLGAFFDRICSRIPIGNPFSHIDSRCSISERFIHEVEKADPFDFLCQLLPRIAREMHQREEAASSDGNENTLWSFLQHGSEHDFAQALLHSLARAMAIVAAERPDKLNDLTPFLQQLSHPSISFLLLKGWMGNPERYADLASNYFAADPGRLSIGYAIWSGGGVGHAAVSREAVKTISPHCSFNGYEQLERAILQYGNSRRESHSNISEHTQHLLLKTIAIERLSSNARDLLEQLDRKFPGIETSFPYDGANTFDLSSPINPPLEARAMSDENWLVAMHQDTINGGSSQSKAVHIVRDLTLVLEIAAQNDKSRFAKLAQTMEDDIKPEYFDAILRGVINVEVDKEHEQELFHGAKQPVDTEAIVALIRRVHVLPNHPCGRWLAWAVKKMAASSFPPDIIEIVSWYAINDPDPQRESWQPCAGGENVMYGGDPVTAGINTTRGAAAEAIAGLLFADKNHWSQLETPVVKLLKDPSVAVRSCTVECLVALLNFNRDQAVQLFFQLVNGADMVLSTQPVDVFLHYAVYSHYSHLRDLMLAMLGSSNERIRTISARQMAVASLFNPSAKSDISSVLKSDESCRKAAAEVYAVNFHNKSDRDICRQQLIGLFNDCSENVRGAACTCFLHFDETQLSSECDFMFAFIESSAFVDNCNNLLYSIEESPDVPPALICAVSEKLFARFRESTPDGHHRAMLRAYKLPDLVMRLYNQSHDANTKSRCLDLIDQMLEFGFDSIESELAKLER